MHPCVQEGRVKLGNKSKQILSVSINKASESGCYPGRVVLNLVDFTDLLHAGAWET